MNFKKTELLLTIVIVFSISLLGTVFAAEEEYIDPNIPDSWYQAPKTASEVGIKEFNQSPMLDEKVANGELPPVKERLPEDPPVIEPYEGIGEYGGTLQTWRDGLNYAAGDWITSKSTGGSPVPDFSKIVPNILKEWEYSNDYQDLTLYLRKGIKWSDGEEFTAEDYIYAWEHYANNEELQNVPPEKWDPPLLNVTKEDKWTVKFHYGRSVPNQHLDNLDSNVASSLIGMGPKHYMKQFHPDFVGKEKSKKLTEEAGLDHWADYYQRIQEDSISHPNYEYQRPVLAPYIAKKRTETTLILERNPYYPFVDPEGNQLPYIDRIQINNADPDMIAVKASTGDSDFQLNDTRLTDIPLYMKNSENEGYKVNIYRWPRGAEPNIKLNLTHENPKLREIFQDVRFRRALSISIDRNKINKKIAYGRAIPRQASILPTKDSKVWKEKYAKAYTEYNPEKAKSLLDEMGMKDVNDDGFRERPDGEKFKITLSYNTPPNTRTLVGELAIQEWENIGLNVELKEISFELIINRWESNTAEMGMWGITSSIGYGNKNPYPWGVTYAPMANPYPAATPWPAWFSWYNTGGDSGMEPPEKMKKLHDLAQIVLSSPDEEKVAEAKEKLFEAQAENLWTIGVLGATPSPVVVDEKLMNVPEKGFIQTIGGDLYYKEQFYLKK